MEQLRGARSVSSRRSADSRAARQRRRVPRADAVPRALAAGKRERPRHPSCVGIARQEQLSSCVASPALLFITDPGGGAVPGFELSAANTAKITGAAALSWHSPWAPWSWPAPASYGPCTRSRERLSACGNGGLVRGRAVPGEPGAAVLTGHNDTRFGEAVFHDLRSIAEGAEIVVSDGAGRTSRFTVTGTETVAKDAFPTEKVYGATGERMLRLVTCDGAFDADGHPVDNLIVYAALR